MFGVQVAVLAVTCCVVIVLLLTAPLWMRLLNAFVQALGARIAETDNEMVIRDEPKDFIEGEFREVDK